MFRPTLDSMVRAGIATIVIIVTWQLTSGTYKIVEQWQAVFLLVIGFYFKDRPQSDRYGPKLFKTGTGEGAVNAEVIIQFLIAMLLLAATVSLFAWRQNKIFLDDVAGAWVGGVTLAVAFYFKDVTPDGTTRLHNTCRAAIAASVGVATLLIFYNRTRGVVEPAKANPLPIQWVALAFVVIGFYFKEKGDVEHGSIVGATSTAPTASAAATSTRVLDPDGVPESAA